MDGSWCSIFLETLFSLKREARIYDLLAALKEGNESLNSVKRVLGYLDMEYYVNDDGRKEGSLKQFYEFSVRVN